MSNTSSNPQHVIIDREWHIRNTLNTKLVSITLKFASFSNEHFDLVTLRGSPLGKIRSNGPNSFVIIKLNELKPREEKIIHMQIHLKRRQYKANDIFSYTIDDIPEKLRRKALIQAKFFTQRRVLNVVRRGLRRSKEILSVIEFFLNFIKRNIQCVLDAYEDSYTIFQRNYGGVEELAFALFVLSIHSQIPARIVKGYRIIHDSSHESKLLEYAWVEVFTPDRWVAVDSCAPRILSAEDILYYIPIKVIENPMIKIHDFSIKFKSVKPTLRRGLSVHENRVSIKTVIGNKSIIAGIKK